MALTLGAQRRTAVPLACSICRARLARDDVFCWNCGGQIADAAAQGIEMEACDIHLVPSDEVRLPSRYVLAAAVMGPSRFYVTATSKEFRLSPVAADWEHEPAFVEALAALIERLRKDRWQPLPGVQSPYGVTLPRFQRPKR